MADYKKALQVGFAAAKKAEIARKEVQEVLEKLRTDILAATEGKLLIEVHTFQEPQQLPTLSPLETTIGNFAKAYAKAMREARPRETYEALAAHNPKVEKSDWKVLARWKASKDGYPCSLTWDKQEHQCEDRTALEDALSELLQDPIVGEALYALSKSSSMKPTG